MKLAANQEVLHHRGNYLVRRQRLAPGEATPWHRDPFHRVTVVLSGDLLQIEFRDGGKTLGPSHRIASTAPSMSAKKYSKRS